MAEANNPDSLSMKLNDVIFTTIILDLPNEILSKIFSMLRQDDILRSVARVCKRFLEITRSPEVLPIVRIYDNLVNPITAWKMQNCLKIYPRSKIEVEIRKAKYSQMSVLDHFGTVSSFVKRMSLGFVLDNVGSQVPFPTFENLDFLWLDDASNSKISMFQIPRFWSHFPNLTYLYFSGITILHGIVSFHYLLILELLDKSNHSFPIDNP